jgi:hypothetical protein
MSATMSRERASAQTAANTMSVFDKRSLKLTRNRTGMNSLRIFLLAAALA